MKNIFYQEKTGRRVIAILMCALMVFSSVSPSFALKSHSKNYTMKYGGTWTYNGKTDYSITKKWSPAKWRSAIVVQEVVFISPDGVKNELYKLSKKVGVAKMNSAVKYAVETAAAHGVSKAKTKVTAKFGAKVAGYVIPFVSYFSWGYVAIDIAKDIGEGQALHRLSVAAEKNKGLIYVKQRGLGDMSRWYYWDGSSTFGKYPNAKLGPNTWQYGTVEKNKKN